MDQFGVGRRFVFISGRSGSGKTSLLEELIKKYDGSIIDGQPTEFRKAKKHTTRTPRADDDPNEFVYHSPEEFEQKVKGKFIKFPYFSHGSGHWYGFGGFGGGKSRSKVILAVGNDETVARDMRYLNRSVNVFVDVNWETLVSRITSRGGDPKVIEERISRLREQHLTPGFGADGSGVTIGMDDYFFGTFGDLEATAHLVVRNNGDLGVAAEVLCEELLPLLRKVPYNEVQGQTLIDVSYGAEGTSQTNVTRLRDDGFVLPCGLRSSEDQLDLRSYGVGLVATLGIVHRKWGPDRNKYALLLHSGDEPLNMMHERRAHFRGASFRILESWGLDETSWRNYSMATDFDIDLQEQLDFSQSRRYFGDNSETPIGVATSYESVTPYARTRSFLQDRGFKRLVLRQK